MTFAPARQLSTVPLAASKRRGHGAAVVGDSLIYLAGAGLVGAANVILLPLYTRFLDTAHFGVYALLDISILIAVTVAQLGFGITYLKWFADLDPSRRGELLGSVIAATLAAGAVGGAVLLLAARASSAWMGMAGPGVLWLLLPIVPLETLLNIFLSDLRARRRSIPFCAAAACRVLITAGTSIWFVRFQRQGIGGILLGRAIGDAAGVAMLSALSLSSAAPRVSLSLLRDMLGYSLPLVWSALAVLGLDASGRYLLARYTSLEEVAVYTVALKVAAVMQVAFLQPFGTAWNATLFQVAREKSGPASITRILGHAFVAGMVLAAGISIVSPLVLPLLGNPAYSRSAALIPWLLLPPAFRILEYWSSAGLYLTNRTGSIAILTTVGAALNIGALLLFASRLGGFGAALAWVFSLGFVICCYAWLSRAHYRLPTAWRPLIVGFGLWAVGAAAALLLPGGRSPASMILSASAVVLTGAAVVRYTRNELRAARREA